MVSIQTKKTKWTEKTEKSSLQQNDYRNKVMVKKLRNLFGCFFLANAPASDKKDLLSELDLMKKLEPHPHVIKLLGCVTETGKRCVKGVLYSGNLWHISFPGDDCTANDSSDRAFSLIWPEVIDKR